MTSTKHWMTYRFKSVHAVEKKVFPSNSTLLDWVFVRHVTQTKKHQRHGLMITWSILVSILSLMHSKTDNSVAPQIQVPACLKGLTEIEEMLIARTKVVMKVRWTSGRQLSYSDHIVNLPQNIEEIAKKLPRAPEDIDMVIIREDSVNLSEHVDFIVRQDKVRAALEWKISHDPQYSDLQQLDEATLSQLPASGTHPNLSPRASS